MMLTEAPQRAEREGWWAGLAARPARGAQRVRRAESRETRERGKRSLAGLLDQVERQHGFPLVAHLGEAGPQGRQRRRPAADWDGAAGRDELPADGAEHSGAPDGGLICEEPGGLQEGPKSVGGQRQDSGTAGRIATCQIGMLLAYARTTGRPFRDRAL